MTIKVFASAQKAMADISSGASIMAGGFGLCGNQRIASKS